MSYWHRQPAYSPARRSPNQSRLTGNAPRLFSPDLQPPWAGEYALRLHRKEQRADPNGFSRVAADAVGVGRREALGVRQLAAALFLCATNVPRTRSA
ncbi:MAG TPA: hypothetical protein PLW35_00400 [Verrucomicrobiota bacterium]|nr:hypothetical protein [Verrucomicrobiota bacterium]